MSKDPSVRFELDVEGQQFSIPGSAWMCEYLGSFQGKPIRNPDHPQNFFFVACRHGDAAVDFSLTWPARRIDLQKELARTGAKLISQQVALYEKPSPTDTRYFVMLACEPVDRRPVIKSGLEKKRGRSRAEDLDSR